MKIPGYLALTAITLVAGIALGGTYSLTKDRINDQARIAAEKARSAVFTKADEFSAYPIEKDGDIDWCYQALAEGEVLGYVAQTTVNGFGGEIEIIAGVDTEGKFTGITVGGSSFSETAGLGEKTKHEAFTSQYAGKAAPLRVIKAGEAAADDTIDAVTAATISSTAVTDGANTIAEFITGIQQEHTGENGAGGDA